MTPPELRSRSARCFILFSVAAVAGITAAIYWPGLHGPLILDDTTNLWSLTAWLQGQYTWQRVVFDNISGPLGRPISMATFLADVALMHATDGFAFKPTNVLIHVLCGLAMLWLATRAFRRWQPTYAHAPWCGLALAAAWLWLPLNVDTVLYTIQRMAQLAALFMLLALGCYMAARERIEQGKRDGQLLLWIGVPALTVLATLSKENGVLAIPLALVLELFLFRVPGQSRPTSIKLFLSLTVGLPVLVGVAYIALHPGFITGGYVGRDFTLTQRLLTEPRVLWRYVQTLLVPLGRYMGFFQDNFPLSTSPLRPWTTLPALLAWLAVAAFGWIWRKGNPLFGAGVWFYLVGQSLESGPIALEIYFEHRNYLPSFGVLLAMAGLLVWVWRRLSAPTRTFRAICGLLLGCVLALYAAMTLGHVKSWRNNETFFYAQGILNPTSPRYQSYLISVAISNHDLQRALAHITIAEQHAPAELLPAITLARFHAYCSVAKQPPANLYAELSQRAQGPINIATKHTAGLLVDDAMDHCPGFAATRFDTIMQRWLDSTPTPATAQTVWETRYDLARMLAARGQLREARDTLHRAWIDSRYDGTIGILLFQLNSSLGDWPSCSRVLAQLEQQKGRGNLQVDRAVVIFRKILADHAVPPSKQAIPEPRS